MQHAALILLDQTQAKKSADAIGGNPPQMASGCHV